MKRNSKTWGKKQKQIINGNSVEKRKGDNEREISEYHLDLKKKRKLNTRVYKRKETVSKKVLKRYEGIKSAKVAALWKIKGCENLAL